MIALPDTNSRDYVVITGKQYCRPFMEALANIGYTIGARGQITDDRIRAIEGFYDDNKKLSFCVFPEKKQINWDDEFWYRTIASENTPFFHFLDLVEEQLDFSDLDSVM